MVIKRKAVIVSLILVTVALVTVALLVLPRIHSQDSSGNGTSNGTVGNGASNGTEPPVTSNWISPGKIFVEDYEPGKTVAIKLQIHNGNSVPTKFSVDYRYPDSLTEGYSKPTGASQWVIPEERFPVIPAQETYTATIWLAMPVEATPPADKWEFWIGVIDQSQSGMVVTELATRVLVSMK